jgi:hypothetical protein
MVASARPLQSDFTGGEFSPKAMARLDAARYRSGLARARNVLVEPVGGLTARAGFEWVADLPALAAPAGLILFDNGVGDCAVVVIQRNTIRIVDIYNRDWMRAAGGAPYETFGWWTDADLPHLRSWQSNDVMYIADARQTAPVRTLTRRGLAPPVWVLADLDIRNGPWQADDGVVALTLAAPSGGSVGMSASANIFSADQIGARIRWRLPSGVAPTLRWEAAQAVTLGSQRQFAGRVYEAVAAGTTGNSAPIHDEGVVSDGVIGWRFLHDGAGIVRITAINAANQATVAIEQTIPLAGVASTYWAWAAFGPTEGFSACGAIHQERLSLTGGLRAKDALHLSRVGGYAPLFADFKPGLGSGQVIDSDAVGRRLETGRTQPIRALLSAGRLWAFTDSAVFGVTGASFDEPITPAGAAARDRSGVGIEASVPPARAASRVIYAARGARSVVELPNDGEEPRNLALLADHITDRLVRKLIYQASPRGVMWVLLADGGLASLTREPNEDVVAWTQHPLGGGARVRDLVVAPMADGRDEVWALIERTVAGAPRWSIEVMRPPWDPARQALEDACQLDGAGLFDAWNKIATQARIVITDDLYRRATLSFTADVLTQADVGRTFALRLAAPAPGEEPGAVAAPFRVLIETVSDARAATCRIVADGPAALVGAFTSRWARCATVLTGLARLEGQTLAVLSDGVPVTGLVVTGGQVALPMPAAKAWVGELFQPELRTLPPAIESQNGSMVRMRQRVERVWLLGGRFDAGTLIGDASGLQPMMVRGADALPAEPPLALGDDAVEVEPFGGWGDDGRVDIVHGAPTPFRLTGMVRELRL